MASSLTHVGVGQAWDPRWSPTAEVLVLVANESRNDEIWLVRKGEWPAVQLTDNAGRGTNTQLVARWRVDRLTVEP